MSIQLINMQSRAIGQDNNKLKKPNNLNMTYYSLGLCKELVVFRVCSNSSNYIHNFLSLFWGCSATWLTLSVRVLGKTLQSGFKTVFCLRKIKKLMKVLAAPYNYLNQKNKEVMAKWQK